MSYADLARLGVTVRPLSGVRPRPGNRYSPFRAPVGQTLSQLGRELKHLDAKSVVLELDFRERDLRLDGLPRADARIGDPTVVLSFESRFGPLRYATAEFRDWTDNLRAIALSMEALRKVDRYGVSKRGEQYSGWRAIPASTDPADMLVSVEQAKELLGRYPDEPDEASALRRALFETHPDHGGDPADFRRVMKAKELLGL